MSAGDPVTEHAHDQAILTRLIGGWQGTLLARARADEPFEHLPASSENRWVLGRQFVQLTLRAGDAGSNWSAVFYVGHENHERRHVLVSLEPGDSRMTVRRGGWTADRGRLVLSTQELRVVYDLTVPGRLTLELVDHVRGGSGYTRFKADYRPAVPPVVGNPACAGSHRRFVIA